MVTTDGLLAFITERIATLTELREQYKEEGDYELDDYTSGAIDAYDIMRMRLES